MDTEDEKDYLRGNQRFVDSSDRIKMASTAIEDLEATMKASIEADEDKKIICGRLTVVLFMMTFFSISLSKFDSDAMKAYEKRINLIETNVTSMLSAITNSTKVIENIKLKTIPDLLKIDYRSKCKTFNSTDFKNSDRMEFELKPFFAAEYPGFSLLDVPFYSVSSMRLNSTTVQITTDYDVFATRVDKTNSARGPVFEFITKLVPELVTVCFMADGTSK